MLKDMKIEGVSFRLNPRNTPRHFFFPYVDTVCERERESVKKNNQNKVQHFESHR